MSQDKRPLILEIKGNSLDDGPGIRSVVFFKGCPLSCAWCHNVESKKPGVEIAFDADACVGCRTCLEVCPEGALSPDNPFYVDRSACTLCFACADACPSGALSRVGRSMELGEVVARVLRDKPFFDRSGGGVTLSGGEPTLFMDYAGALAARFREAGVHVLIETCGLFDPVRFAELVYPHLDQIYMDIKIMDPAAHQRHCGVDNRHILENFRTLSARAREGGVPVLPRIPLIPGLTDSRDNLSAIAEFLAAQDAREVALLPYNPLWRDKTHKMGVAYAGGPEMERWMTPEHVEWCRVFFGDFDIQGG